MVKKLYCLLFLFIFSDCFSQSIHTCLNKAKNDVERGEYYLAVAHYLDALKIDSLNKKANLEFGLLNTEYINNPSRAGIYLLRAEKTSEKDTLPELVLGLAQYYQSVGQYKEAIIYYKRLLSKMEKTADGKALEISINKNITNCNYALSSPPQPVYKRLKTVNAGKEVNTIYSEYFPVLTNNETILMFTARRRDNIGHRTDDFDGNYYEDMFIARKGPDGGFKNAHPFSSSDSEVNGLSNTKEHEAVVSVSAKGDKFFTFLNDKLYESEWQNNKWTAPKTMSAIINPADAFQSFLSTSADGKTIYFSSERPEGLGKLDIYKSEMQPNGNWGPAVNLGPAINTKDDDDSPFISHDGKTLYFASKGHPGYGEYDLFKSVFNGSNWEAPFNMGILFNSSGNDVHLWFNKDETSGVFASSRAGGFGDMDIYEIKTKGPFEDFSIDALARININMPDTFYVNEPVTIGVFSNKLPPSVFKQYYWQVNDSVLITNGEIAKYSFAQPGIARIRVAGLTSNNDIIGYEKKVPIVQRTITVATNTTAIAGNVTVATATVNTNAVKGNITKGEGLDNIYFKFNKYIINSEARQTILHHIKVLNDNPSLSISIAAYCDSRGSVKYNQALSEKRAATTVWFLVKHGINKNRIKTVQAFGEKDPLNKCADGTPCTAGEYKINRRVEFKLTAEK